MKRSRRRSTWRTIPVVGASAIQRSGRTRNGRDSRKLTSLWDAPASWDWLGLCMHQMFGSSTSRKGSPTDPSAVPLGELSLYSRQHHEAPSDFVLSIRPSRSCHVSAEPIASMFDRRWKTKHERLYLIIYLLRYFPPIFLVFDICSRLEAPPGAVCRIPLPHRTRGVSIEHPLPYFPYYRL
jgi:hypothetical protein